MRKLGVGVLGVGEMGKRHAENLRRLVPEARSLSQQRRKRLKKGRQDRSRTRRGVIWWPEIPGAVERLYE